MPVTSMTLLRHRSKAELGEPFESEPCEEGGGEDESFIVDDFKV
jgi:hypothetical protein